MGDGSTASLPPGPQPGCVVSHDGRVRPQCAHTLVLPWECGPRAETVASYHHATVYNLGTLGRRTSLCNRGWEVAKGSTGEQCEGEKGLAAWSQRRCLGMVTKCWATVNLLTNLQISSACLSWGHHVSRESVFLFLTP